jgi:hypothetical protein
MKKIKITLYILAAIAVIVFMGVAFANVNVYETKVDTIVKVENGKATKEGFEQTIVLKNDGIYRMNAKWKTEPSGMITGFEFLNEQGESYNTFTAEWISMQSRLLEIPAGEYTLRATYLTSEEAVKEFFQNAKLINLEWDVPYVEDEFEYQFVSNGTFETTYEFSLVRDIPLYQIMMVCGLVLGFLLVAIVMTIATKDKKAKYDERQALVRGRGFAYGFSGLLISNLVVFLLDIIGIDLHMRMSVAMLICSLVGITISACYCIWNDGYFAINQNKGLILIVIGIGGVINIGIGIASIVCNTFWINDQLSAPSMNLFCGIMCIVIWVTLFAKCLKDRKEA